jgi:hypothetical protein
MASRLRSGEYGYHGGYQSSEITGLKNRIRELENKIDKLYNLFDSGWSFKKFDFLKEEEKRLKDEKVREERNRRQHMMSNMFRR